MQKIFILIVLMLIIAGSYFVIRNSYKNTGQLLSLLNKPGPTDNPQQYHTVVGKVIATKDKDFTLQSPSRTYTFRITPLAQLLPFNGHGKVSMADISLGSYVRVTYPILEDKFNPIVPSGIFIDIPETMVNPLEGTISKFESDKFTLSTATIQLTILVDKQTRWEGEGKANVKQNFIYTGAKVKVYAVPVASLSAYLARGIIVDFSK